MGFTDRAKIIALAIVHIFETSKAFGDYAACVVLRDGAGVSYGINQFTHRSGSLLAVVMRYLQKRGTIGRAPLEEALPTLKLKTTAAILDLSGDARFKKALKAAAATREMREAQHEISEEKYLRPALDAAEGSGFVLPLSLAVIFDSINHGSFARIRDRVKISRKSYSSDIEFEKAWIYSYVKNRDAWLEGHSNPLLRTTDYRTDFFLAQIARGNWTLELPMNVHGFKLSADIFKDSTVEHDEQPTVVPDYRETPETPPEPPEEPAVEAQPSNTADQAAGEEGVLDKAGEMYGAASEKFDKVSDVVSGIGQRKDAAKSMWTTIGGTIWQSVWAVIAFFIGLPREIWIAVAVFAGLLMVVYLYRQNKLGIIRERAHWAMQGVADRLK
jgi:chitosanase